MAFFLKDTQILFFLPYFSEWVHAFPLDEEQVDVLPLPYLHSLLPLKLFNFYEFFTQFDWSIKAFLGKFGLQNCF